MKKLLRKHKMGRMGLSSNVLQSPMQVAGFAPRNGRGSVEKKRR